MSVPARADVLATLLPGFAGAESPDWLVALLREGLGGVCLFGANVVSREQTARLTAQILTANPDAIIAIDEEGGDVTRLYGDGSPFPGNALLGRIGELALTEYTARTVGRLLRGVGVTTTFAPDADINSHPDNPVIGVRSFGTDPVPVAEHTAAWVKAVQATGIAATAKHFPGHGDTAQDSHRALPVVDRSLAELRERELVPFRAAIAAGTELIMTSHILLPRLDPVAPASMSRAVLQGLLRGELGYDGVIVTDALDMAGASAETGIPIAAVRALAAGADLLCLGTGTTAERLESIVAAVTAAVALGALAGERVTDAAARVRALAARLAERRAAVVPPRASEPEPSYDLGVLASGFAVTPHARAWIQASAGRYEVMRVASAGNEAVGAVPWGLPVGAGARDDVSTRPTGDGRLCGPDRAGPQPPEFTVVLGAGIHRHPAARRAVDRLRAERGGRVLVVDMGWPSDDRAYADIATFGASRVVGAALCRLLGGAE